MTPLPENAAAQTSNLLPARTSSQTLLRALLRIGGSILVLVLIFRILPLGQVWAALRLLPAELWIMVLAGYLIAHIVGVAKWRMMVNLAGAGLTFAQAARCYFAGLFSTLFLPSIVGGDVVRAGLALRLGRSKAAVLLGSLIDRMLDVTALVSLTALGALLAPSALDPVSRRLFMRVAVAGALAGVIAIATLALLPARYFSFRIRRKLVRVRTAWRSILRQPQYVFATLALGVLIQGSFVLFTVRVADACALHLPLRAWLFAWPLAKLSALLPVTQGGIGVREAALAALLVPFGARAVLTVAVGLAWEAIIISGGLLAGLASFLLGKFAARN